MTIEESKNKYTIRKDKSKKYLMSQIKRFIKQAEKDNEGLIPYHGDGNCNTCGNEGLAHPKSSFCFICDTDNW